MKIHKLLSVASLGILTLMLNVLVANADSISGDIHCRPCADGSPTQPVAGGVVYAYYVHNCDTWLCSHYPIGQRQAVITTYETVLGLYSTCCCTPCGMNPFRACPVEE